MKRFIESQERRQTTLLPDSLEDYVTDDNPVRAVDVFVDELDLAAIGFAGVAPEATGRPVYHPATLDLIDDLAQVLQQRPAQFIGHARLDGEDRLAQGARGGAALVTHSSDSTQLRKRNLGGRRQFARPTFGETNRQRAEADPQGRHFPARVKISGDAHLKAPRLASPDEIALSPSTAPGG